MRTVSAIRMTPLLLTLVACSSSSSAPAGPAASSEAGAPHDAASGVGDTGGQASDAAKSEGGTSATVDAKLVLDVPATFSGATREIDVVVVPQLPVAGPPAGILFQETSPAVTAGQPMTIHGDATGVTGENYVVVVLYMQGGGSFAPKAGVDYVAQSSAKVDFNGAAVDLGTLKLSLAGGDGGP